jgi:hypothetical protein
VEQDRNEPDDVVEERSTREPNDAVAMLGLSLVLAFGCWLSWRATELLRTNPDRYKPERVKYERTQLLPLTPRERRLGGSNAAKTMVVHMRAVAAAEEARDGGRVGVGDVLRQLRKLDEASATTAREYRAILNGLRTDGLVEDHPKKGFHLTRAGKRAVADARGGGR